MNIDWNLAVAVGMPIVTLFLGALLNHLVETRAKLISHLGFISSHRLAPQPNGQPGAVVNTHSVIIKNSGRRAATNVHVGHSFLPDFNIYPDLEHEVRDLPGGGKEIVIPILVPKKEISINYLYFAPQTWNNINTHIESDSGAAKVVNVLLQPQLKPWLIKFLWALLLIGAISSLYLLAIFVRWLVV